MTASGSRSFKKMFADAPARVSVAVGRPMAFGLALCIIIIWVLSGPSSRYSDTWQVIINTGTTILTFLMVFLIQNTQNRDSAAAIQTKLDELIRASRAQNAFIGIERLTQEEIEQLRKKKRSTSRNEPSPRMIILSRARRAPGSLAFVESLKPLTRSTISRTVSLKDKWSPAVQGVRPMADRNLWSGRLFTTEPAGRLLADGWILASEVQRRVRRSRV